MVIIITDAFIEADKDNGRLPNEFGRNVQVHFW